MCGFSHIYFLWDHCITAFERQEGKSGTFLNYAGRSSLPRCHCILWICCWTLLLLLLLLLLLPLLLSISVRFIQIHLGFLVLAFLLCQLYVFSSTCSYLHSYIMKHG